MRVKKIAAGTVAAILFSLTMGCCAQDSRHSANFDGAQTAAAWPILLQMRQALRQNAFPRVTVRTQSTARQCAVADSSWKGSYYHKIISPAGYVGMTGDLTLPTYVYDPKRYYHVDHSNPKIPMSWEGPLDEPSVYVGASNPDNGRQLDTGLNRKPVYRSEGQRLLTDTADPRESVEPAHQYVLAENATPPILYAPKGIQIAQGWPQIDAQIAARSLRYFFAFVPFWRTRTWNMDDTMAFLPGDHILISVRLLAKDGFHISIHSTPSTLDDRSLSFDKDIHAPGFGFSPAELEFKRVNSIDQYRFVNGQREGNEGPGVSAIATAAKATGGLWGRAMLIKDNGSQIPFGPPNCTIVRGIDTAPNYNKIFNSSGIDPFTGAETIDIVP